MRSVKKMIAMAIGAMAAAALMGTGVAAAAPPDPTHGQECGGVISNVHRVSASAIQATWTLECNYAFLGAINPVGVAVRTAGGSSQTTYASGSACSGTINSCSRTATFPDVGGTQTYWLTWDNDAYITFAGGTPGSNSSYRCGDPNLYAHQFCQRLYVQY